MVSSGSYGSPRLQYGTLFNSTVWCLTYSPLISLRTTHLFLSPHVYASSCSLDNPLSRPYTLMSFLEGTPLANLWFDPVWMTDQRRHRVFESLALAMSQPSSFTFPKIGELVPDPGTGRATVGPIYPTTQKISDDGATSEDAMEPYDSTYEYLLNGIKLRASLECRRPLVLK